MCNAREDFDRGFGLNLQQHLPHIPNVKQVAANEVGIQILAIDQLQDQAQKFWRLRLADDSRSSSHDARKLLRLCQCLALQSQGSSEGCQDFDMILH